MRTIARYMKDVIRTPCYNSIRSYSAKRGQYCLQSRYSTAVKGGCWCIIADLSIRVGKQRILLVLGVDLTAYDFCMPLTFSDIKVLAMGIKEEKSWTGQSIAHFIKVNVLDNYEVIYAVTDGGANLINAMRRLKLERIDDVGHAMARLLKKAYGNKEIFEKFIVKVAHMRKYKAVGGDRHMKPEKLRGTARFMNIGPLVDWAVEACKALDSGGRVNFKSKPLTAERRAKLVWLEGFRPLVKELQATFHFLNNIQSAIKSEGINQAVARRILKWLKYDMAAQRVKPPIITGIKKYLEEQLAACQRLGLETVLASSDILESIFGHYKESALRYDRVTQYSLRMAIYGNDLGGMEHVEAMMQQNTNAELRDWVANILICDNI